MPATITTQLVAGKEYLLIFGLDDPNDFNGSNSLTLTIQQIW